MFKYPHGNRRNYGVNMMKKYISLTFDDGPCSLNDDVMNKALDILQKHNVLASFFVIGNKITPENKKTIKRAFDAGCDIQNHSWSHPFMSKLSKEQILEEYNKCDDAIFEITGKKAEFFRPPFIDVSDLMHETIPVPFICGYGVEDWVPQVSAEERYERMLKAAKDGLLYLLHVMEGNEATLQAVDKIIPILKEQNYEFATVPKMFELKNVQKKANSGILWTEVKSDL